jgi:hypothetical protein
MGDDDFDYDSNDVLAVKSAFNKMVESDRQAFWYGIVGGVATSVLLRRSTNQLPWMRLA